MHLFRGGLVFVGALVAALFVGSAPVRAQMSGAVSDTTNIDGRWNRTWPAGPFSQVSTSWGVLQTEIPLFQIEGPGGTSMGYSVYHRSNQNHTTHYGVLDAGVGAGWSQSAINAVGPGSGDSLTQFKGGNSTSAWQANVRYGVTTYARRPGTRADVTRLEGTLLDATPLGAARISSGGATIGYEVVEQADRSRWVYRETVAPQTLFRLSSVVDKHGNTLSVQYDAQHRPIRVTDASGQRFYTIAYTPELNAQVASVTLHYPGGSKMWSMGYNSANGQLGYIEYPALAPGEGRPRLHFGYDNNTNITDVWDLNGNRWHYSYADTTGFSGVLGVRAVHEPAPQAPGNWNSANYTTFAWSTYTPGGAVADWTKTCAITDPLGRQWRHVYYNNGGNDYFANPLKSVQDPYIAADGVSYGDLHTWNQNDATLSRYVDKRGQPWEMGYDGNNRGLMLWKKNPLSHTTQFLYDANDKLVRTVDPTGDRTLLAYDPNTLALTRSVVDPKTDPYDPAYNRPAGVALTTHYAYDGRGELAATWRGSDPATTYSNFDAFGNAQTVTAPSGASTTLSYDALNNKTSVSEPSPGGTTHFAYDPWNRLVRTTHPYGSYTETVYDLNGNTLSVRDEKGIATTTLYDGLNRAVSVRRPVDGNANNDLVVGYGYDAAGNQTSLTNARNKITRHEFNERGDLVRILYPDGTTRRAGYDGNGNRTRRWDGKSRLTSYEYDPAGRLVRTLYPDNTWITNTWRADDVRTGMTDATGTTTWAVNGAGQLTHTFQPRTGKSVSHSYDAGGRRRTLSLEAQTWTFNYDTGLRLGSIGQTLGAGIVANFGYYPNGALQARTMGSANLRTWFAYDARGRNIRIEHNVFGGASETQQQRLDYAYDEAGNVSTYTNATAGRATETTTYGYDGANRLTGETRWIGPSNTSYVFATGYIHDKSGNRAQVWRDGVQSFYSVDDNDRLQSGEGFSLWNYDGDGNPGNIFVPGSGTFSFVYDCESRPVRVTHPNGVVTTYTYDGDGRRVEKRVGPHATRYVYDAATIIAEIDASGGGNPITGFHLPGVGFVNTWNGQQFLYQESGIGSTLAVRDGGVGGAPGNSAVLHSRSEYDAFGITQTLQAGARSSFQFAGKHGYVTDDDTGMMLLGARFYLPKLGRFLTQDPIGHEGGLNLYAYCDNNPLTKVDPTGLTPPSFDEYQREFTNFVNGTSRSWSKALGFLGDYLLVPELISR